MPVESHEVERKILKLVCPLVILFQLLFQPPHGKLGKHDLGQAHIVDLKAAPQSVHSLSAEVQGIFTDEGCLPTARWACSTDRIKLIQGQVAATYRTDGFHLEFSCVDQHALSSERPPTSDVNQKKSYLVGVTAIRIHGK